MNNELQFLIYKTPDHDENVNVIVKNDTIWTTQKGMAKLFGCTSDNVSLHLKNIYDQNELDPNRTAEEISVVHFDEATKMDYKFENYQNENTLDK